MIGKLPLTPLLLSGGVILSAMTVPAMAQQGGLQLETDFSNGCNALRYVYGQKKAGVLSSCSARGQMEAPIPSAGEEGSGEGVIEPSEPAPPTEEDYNAWVEFFRTNCTGGSNITEFSQIVDRTSTWYCRSLDDPISFPAPAPTYFVSALDFHHSDGITSLSGFDYLESIPGMSLAYSDITTVMPLSNLTSLGVFVADWTLLEDFRGFDNITDMTTLSATAAKLQTLSGLDNLQTVAGNLNLDSNQLTHVDGLRSLTRVGGVLNLANNANLESISGLSNLTSVKELVISGSKLGEIDALQNLTNVDYRILLWYNRDLQNLDGLSGLTHLDLNIWHNTGLKDVTGLSNLSSGNVSATSNMNNSIQVKMSSQSDFCTGVRNGSVTLQGGLYYGNYCDGEGKEGAADPENAWVEFANFHCLTSNYVSSLAGVEEAVLGCAYQNINTLKSLPPPAPKAINILSMYNGLMEDIGGLAYVETANAINLRFLNIVDASPLSSLTSVNTLSLQSNEIEVLPDLTGLVSYGSLDFSYNNITSLVGVPILPNAGDLIFTRNQISDLTPLLPITSAGRLDLSQNLIKSTYGLDNLTHVTDLNLGSNQLTDLTGLKNISSGKVTLGLISDGYQKLDNSTAFCTAVRAGAVVLSAVNRTVDDFCMDGAPTLAGRWVWTDDKAISRASRENVPVRLESSVCVEGSGFTYTPANNLEAYGAASGDACLSNTPYPSGPAGDGQYSQYAVNDPLPDGFNEGAGVCHPANTFQCIDTAGMTDTWVETNRLDAATFESYSSATQNEFISQHNKGMITSEFTIDLQGRLCLNAGDNYLRDEGAYYVTYSCGGVAPAGGSMPVSEVVCDTENGTPLSEPVQIGGYSPSISNQTYSFTQTAPAEQQQSIRCYEGQLNAQTGEIEQGDFLYEEEQTVEVALEREILYRAYNSKRVDPDLCGPRTPTADQVCKGEVFRQSGSCRYDPLERGYFFYEDGSFIKTRGGSISDGSTVYSQTDPAFHAPYRYVRGTDPACDHSGTGGSAPTFYPESYLDYATCEGKAVQYGTIDGYSYYWNNTLIKQSETHSGSLNGIVDIGNYNYFVAELPNTYTGVSPWGESTEITEYRLCRRDVSRFESWPHPDDTQLTGAEAEAYFFGN